jgi:alpha-L-rhamnosidase
LPESFCHSLLFAYFCNRNSVYMNLSRTSFAAALLLMIVSCGTQKTAFVGERTEALDASAWKDALWLSVADAPVITGRVDEGGNGCSAPGASVFVSTIKNEKKVVAAKWMTTALGVYDLYVNGLPVGEEVLKPGFTHPMKTKRTFSYNITRALRCGAGEENVLAVQVAPGWWADKIVTPSGNKEW